jgi:endo-1,4-beta-xylanase
MKLRWFTLVGAVAVAVLGVLGVVSTTAADRTTPKPSEQSLRALGARHGLSIGTAVDMQALDDATDPRYSALVASQFSTVTAENVMKWEALEPTRGTYDWRAADKLIDFARKNNQRVRGHVLVWQNQLPKWLTDGVAGGTIGKDELRALLQKHVTDVVTHFKGKIWQWDVVNEGLSDPWDTPNEIHYKGFWNEHYGPGYVADAFRWARAADRDALLFYNDYNIEAFGDGGPKDKVQFLYNEVNKLLSQGVPIDGIGSQGHLGTQYGNYDALQVADTIQRFTDLGLAYAFTEVDVRSQMSSAVKSGSSAEVNPRLQASAANFSALLQGCLANRHCLSFTFWGFTDKHSWIPTWDFGAGKGAEGMATLYDESYQPKRALNTIKADLFYAGPPNVQPRITHKPRRDPSAR